MKNIVIKGAREHNLRNITVEIPRDRLIVITGLSGSGKSTLAFDTLYAEGQRRYVESLSTYARQFLGLMNKPDVDSIEGLSPAISIEQKTTSKNPRSTVGTTTEIYDYLRLLFARIGIPYCPVHHIRIESQTPEKIADQIANEHEGMVTILSPVVRQKKGTYQGSDTRPAYRGVYPCPREQRDPPHRRGDPAGTIPEAGHRDRHRPARDHRSIPAGGGLRERPCKVGGRPRPGACRGRDRDALLITARLPDLRHRVRGAAAPDVLVQQPVRGLRGVQRSGDQDGLRSRPDHPG
jgi:hypothetical protein